MNSERYNGCGMEFSSSLEVTSALMIGLSKIRRQGIPLITGCFDHLLEGPIGMHPKDPLDSSSCLGGSAFAIRNNKLIIRKGGKFFRIFLCD